MLEPLSAPVIERMTIAFAQLPRIKSPGSGRTHARGGQVYLYLVWNADRKSGEVFRSIRTLAADVGCSQRQASESTELLIGLDLLRKRLGTPEAGRWPTCIYTLLQPAELVTVDHRRRSIADYPGTTDPTATPDPDRAHARGDELRESGEPEICSPLSSVPPEADGLPPEIVKALRDLDPAEIVPATGISALYLAPVRLRVRLARSSHRRSALALALPTTQRERRVTGRPVATQRPRAPRRRPLRAPALGHHDLYPSTADISAFERHQRTRQRRAWPTAWLTNPFPPDDLDEEAHSCHDPSAA